jgi:hypothetical protein
LGVLKEWTESKNSKLAVAAARVLANLDTDFSEEILEDGILVLHPLARSTYVEDRIMGLGSAVGYCVGLGIESLLV